MANPVQSKCSNHKKVLKQCLIKLSTSNEIKFNDLERKIYRFVCYFGCLTIKIILEKYEVSFDILNES